MESQERRARARIREALEEANDPSNPITDLSDFLILVKEHYLAPAAYKKYQKSIVVEMWFQQQNSRPPSPAASTARDSLESKAIDVLGDNHDGPPSIELEAEIRSIWLVQPTNAQFGHATYKLSSSTGSYIRADSMRNNDLKARGDGIVVIQWDPSGPSGIKDNSDDNAATHTACRIVNEDEAKSMNMNVDLVLGTDCRKELEQQEFGAPLVPRAAQRLHGATEEEPQTPTLPAGSPFSEQVACLPAPTQPIININGPIFLGVGADLATIYSLIPSMGCHPVATHRATTGLAGNVGRGPGVAGNGCPQDPRGISTETQDG